MAARCLPVVIDQQTIAIEISEIFREFRLDAQNELHGGLMGIKNLVEFYSFRGLRDSVFGIFPRNGTELDAVITGLEDYFDTILRKNSNPSTKAAFIEIATILRREVKANELMKKVLQACLEDIRGGKVFPVGSDLYFERATTLLLDMIADWRYGSVESPEKILSDLLRSENNEVILKALDFINEFKPEGMSSIRGDLELLLSSNRSKRVRAWTLQSLSSIGANEKSGLSLKYCLDELEMATVLPLKEAWIIHCGYAAREVLDP
jgi:hypothetical protein